jgi:hypothetical protein
LSPRLGWHATDWLTVELTGQTLWPYKDVVSQKMETSGFLSVKVAY